MNLENLILMGFYAEGYYSGSSKTVGIVCKKGQEHIIKKYNENINEQSMYFFELDGKHSETKGEYFEIENNLHSIMETIKGLDFSNDLMFEFELSIKEKEDEIITNDIIRLNKLLYEAKVNKVVYYTLIDECGNEIITIE